MPSVNNSGKRGFVKCCYLLPKNRQEFAIGLNYCPSYFSSRNFHTVGDYCVTNVRRQCRLLLNSYCFCIALVYFRYANCMHASVSYEIFALIFFVLFSRSSPAIRLKSKTRRGDSNIGKLTRFRHVPDSRVPSTTVVRRRIQYSIRLLEPPCPSPGFRASSL